MNYNPQLVPSHSAYSHSYEDAASQQANGQVYDGHYATSNQASALVSPNHFTQQQNRAQTQPGAPVYQHIGTTTSPQHRAHGHFHNSSNPSGRTSPYGGNSGNRSPFMVSPSPSPVLGENEAYRHSPSLSPNRSQSCSPVPEHYRNQYARQNSQAFTPVQALVGGSQYTEDVDIAYGQQLPHDVTHQKDRYSWVRGKVCELERNISDISMQLTKNNCRMDELQLGMAICSLEMQRLQSSEQRINQKQTYLSAQLKSMQDELQKFISVLMIPSMGIYPPPPQPMPQVQHGPFVSRSRISNYENIGSSRPELVSASVEASKAQVETSDEVVTENEQQQRNEVVLSEHKPPEAVAIVLDTSPHENNNPETSEITASSQGINDSEDEKKVQRLFSPPATPVRTAKANGVNQQDIAATGLFGTELDIYQLSTFLSNVNDQKTGDESGANITTNTGHGSVTREVEELMPRAGEKCPKISLGEIEKLNLDD